MRDRRNPACHISDPRLGTSPVSEKEGQSIRCQCISPVNIPLDVSSQHSRTLIARSTGRPAEITQPHTAPPQSAHRSIAVSISRPTWERKAGMSFIKDISAQAETQRKHSESGHAPPRKLDCSNPHARPGRSVATSCQAAAAAHWAPRAASDLSHLLSGPRCTTAQLCYTQRRPPFLPHLCPARR